MESWQTRPRRDYGLSLSRKAATAGLQSGMSVLIKKWPFAPAAPVWTNLASLPPDRYASNQRFGCTAKALGLTIPQSVLLRANEVMQ